MQLIKAATLDDEFISPTQGATHLWIVWCGYGARQGREGVKNSQGRGMGPKRCPLRAWHANTPPYSGHNQLPPLFFKLATVASYYFVCTSWMFNICGWYSWRGVERCVWLWSHAHSMFNMNQGHRTIEGYFSGLEVCGLVASFCVLSDTA